MMICPLKVGFPFPETSSGRKQLEQHVPNAAVVWDLWLEVMDMTAVIRNDAT
jgi:hypothetical protein